MKIYFLLPEGTKFLNIRELILFGYNPEEDSSRFRFVPTYYDVECTHRQCLRARRSFEDLLAICETYFPETTERELAKTLFSLNKEIHLYPFYCNDISKVVFHCSYPSQGWCAASLFPNINARNNKGSGAYSMNDLMYLLIEIPE